MRRFILYLIFSSDELIAICNALYRRVDDNRTKDVEGEQSIRDRCAKIAKEIMEI